MSIMQFIAFALPSLSAFYWALVYVAHGSEGFWLSFAIYFVAGACMVFFGMLIQMMRQTS